MVAIFLKKIMRLEGMKLFIFIINNFLWEGSRRRGMGV